jgi:hypothetical protein
MGSNNKTKTRVIKIGYVGVDSGVLMVCDPCYIESEWEKGHIYEDAPNGERGAFNYDGVCQAAREAINGSGQLFYKAGHAGVGVALPSGFGDGYYPVYAKVVDYGEYGERIQSISIRLISKAEVKMMDDITAESDICSCCGEKVNLKEVEKDSFKANSSGVTPDHPSKG